MRTILVQRLRDERGITVPLSMFVISLLVLLGGVSLRQAVFTSDESNEDRGVKRALQAADAGIDTGIYRMNMFDLVNEPTSKCVARQTTGQLELTGYGQDGWCSPVNQPFLNSVEEDLGDGTSFSYKISPEGPTGERTIVSTGTANGQTRRVAADIEASAAGSLFGTWGVTSRDQLDMFSKARVDGSVRSNKGIVLDSHASVQCLADGTQGLATPGPGYAVTELSSDSYVCGSTAPATEEFTLPPVNVDLAENDNDRICNTSYPDGGDPCTDGGNIRWDPVKRHLELDSNSTLTLGGSVYSFCYLELKSNTQLIIPSKPDGSSVRIYIDRREDCPGVDEPFALLLDSNSTINNLNDDPQALQIYVEGSLPVELNSNASSEISTAIYAPESVVTLKSNTSLLGGIVGKKVTMDSNSRVIYDPRIADIVTDGVFPLMSRKAYRECQNPPPSAVPDSGC